MNLLDDSLKMQLWGRYLVGNGCTLIVHVKGWWMDNVAEIFGMLFTDIRSFVLVKQLQ